jgi:hypothetical protein
MLGRERGLDGFKELRAVGDAIAHPKPAHRQFATEFDVAKAGRCRSTSG